MLRKAITAAIIAATEIVLTLDWWDSELIKTLMVAVVFWWMNLLLLIGMEKEEKEE